MRADLDLLERDAELHLALALLVNAVLTFVQQRGAARAR